MTHRVVVSLIGLGFVLISLPPSWRWWRRDRQVARWTHVEGRIVDTRHHRTTHDGDEIHLARVTFRLPDGRHITGWAPDGFRPDVRQQVGQSIQVWYSPSDPECFRASRAADPLTPRSAYAIMLGFTAVGILMLLIQLL